MTTFEIASVLGLILGPIAGAVIAFKLQDRAIVRARRLDDFRTLMRNRRTSLSSEFVGAFNLVEIDFAGERNVVHAHRKLFDHFCNNPARQPSEEHQLPDTDEIRAKKDNLYGTRCLDERQRLLTKLLFSMGKALGYKIEQLEILEGGYRPNLHAEIETQQEIFRRFLMSVASGERAVPIKILDK